MSWLVLVPILPLAGALVLLTLGGRLPRRASAAIGCASVGLAWVVNLLVTADYFRAAPGGGRVDQVLYSWFGAGSLDIRFGLALDQLSLVMMNVITFVGFLIHLYSVEFMREEEGYARFFGYMNLFLGAMLLLVLGDNFVSLYLGWEGVGLCSYLLIGFWYRDPNNGRAARKAFLLTRLGDTAFAIGLFLLFARLGTLDIRTAMAQVGRLGPVDSPLAIGVALLLLGGAVGKSAQLPLQTWLPDAMAGPTPVSALIHAATMVTAGVYLIARTHVLFLHAPTAMGVVAAVGIATAIYAAVSALAQRDLKRVLAYSTMSQIGYMFLALGVGAFSAALFHFFTHAFFKALLFLAAGLVIQAQHEEHDIYRMGGLFRALPVAGWTFLAGAASLAGLPLVTAGFYSKDIIVWESWGSPFGSAALLLFALLGSLLTALYIFRTFFLVFLGPRQREVGYRPGLFEQVPVVVLAGLSLVAGFLGMPQVLGGFRPLLGFLDRLFGPLPGRVESGEGVMLLLSALLSLGGIGIAYWLWQRQGQLVATEARRPAWARAGRFFREAWGVDWLYDRAFVRPYQMLARGNRADVIDYFYTGLALGAAESNRLLARAQSGRVRHYATALLLAGVVSAALLLWVR